MNEYSQAVNILEGKVTAMVEQTLKKAPFDITKKGYIQESLGQGRYKVAVNGSSYTVTSRFAHEQNEVVRVTFPQNNQSEGFICS